MKKILDGLGDSYRKQLWKNRDYVPFQGPPPDPVVFPNPEDIRAEVAKLKERLRKQAAANGDKIDLRLRNANYKGGMFLGQPDAPEAAPADVLTAAQIGNGTNDGLITEDLMRGYFANIGVNPKQSKPIPHDRKHHDQDVWLPGLFVIDQIFAALVTETWTKCVKYNEAHDAVAKADLDSFVDRISGRPDAQPNPDAEKYLPFINYSGDAKDKTWIDLITDTAGSVVGALIHVHDWASGTHSNGTGIP
jgi:hypothetical protein